MNINISKRTFKYELLVENKSIYDVSNICHKHRNQQSLQHLLTTYEVELKGQIV